jgi:tape measure domain-containing protein
MTIDVSRLAIEVTSTGINEARKALDGGNGNGGLYKAAEKVEKKVGELEAGFARLASSGGALAQAFAQTNVLANFASLLGQVSSSAATAAQSLRAMANQATAAGAAAGQAGQGANQAAQGFQNQHRHMSIAETTLRAMITAATTYLSLNFAKGVIESADAFTMMQAKLKIATGSMDDAVAAQKGLFQLAQKIRAPMEDTAKLFTRMSVPMDKMGKGTQETRDHIEGLMLALKLNGATAAEASSAMLQYSQSVNAGRLNGGEFNAIAEAAPSILRAIEAELRATGRWTNLTTETLKEMGSKGEISFDLMHRAMMRALPGMRDQFNTLPVTVDGAMQRIKNAWFMAVGEMGQDTELTKRINESLSKLEAALPGIARTVGEVFVTIMDHIKSITTALTMLGTGALLSGLLGVLGRLGSAWANAAASTAAATAATVAAGTAAGGAATGFTLLRTAMVFLGGPIVGPIIAIGTALAGAVTAWNLYKSSAVKESQEASKSINQSVNESLDALDKEIAKLKERNRLRDQPPAPATPVGGPMQTAAEAFITAEADMRKAQNREGEYAIKNEAAYQAILQKRVETYGRALQTYETLVAQQKKVDSDIRSDNLNKLNEKFKDTFGGNAEKIEDAIKKWKRDIEELGGVFTPEMESKIREKYKIPKTAAENDNERDIKRHKTAMKELEASLARMQEINNRLLTDGTAADKLLPETAKVIELQQAYDALVKSKGANSDFTKRAKEELTAGKKAEDVALMNQAIQESLKLQEQYNQKIATQNNNAGMELATLKEKIANFGKVGEGASAAQAKVDELNAQMAALCDQASPGLYKLRDTYNEIIRAKTELDELELNDKIDKLLDPKKAKKFGDAFKDAFGEIGKGFKKIVEGIQRYDVAMDRVKDIEKLRDATTDLDKKAKLEAKAVETRVQAELGGMADVASASKEFFDERSKGYKILEAAEKTFRLFQMGMQVQSFLQESGFLSAITALFVSSKATETAAETASVGPHVAAEGAKQSANAVTALTSALAAPFPANIPAFALVAAMLASIGVAIGGAQGGGTVDPGNTGTGTVLGDNTAQSKSIETALDKLSEVDSMTMKYSAQMASSLRSIEGNIGGLATLLVRSGTGDFSQYNSRSQLSGGDLGGVVGNFFGGPIGAVVGKLAASLPIIGGLLNKVAGFVYNSKSTITAQGIYGGDQSLSSILQNGYDAQYYADIHSRKKMLGVTVSSSDRTRTTQEGTSELDQQFTLVLEGFADSLRGAAGALDLPLTQIESSLNNFVVRIGKIDLKGLTSDEIAEKLTAVFGAEGDRMAHEAIAGFDAFQQVGEGYLETVVRVASGVEEARTSLQMYGLALSEITRVQDIANKQAEDIGAEIVRDTLVNQQRVLTGGHITLTFFGQAYEIATTRLTGIGEIMQDMTGDASDLIAAYTQLTDAQKLMQDVGFNAELNRNIIIAAGGLDKLQNSLEAYSENYFTDAERQARGVARMRESFAAISSAMTMPTTAAGFRALVEATTNPELKTKLLALAESFYDLADAGSELVSAARDDLADAYSRESDALKDTKEKFEDFAKSLHDFRDSLVTGDFNPSSVSEKYRNALSKFNSTATAALGGDENAIGAFQTVAESLLSLSREMYASGDQYTADYQRVLELTQQLEGVSNGRVSEAQQQLNLLEQQVGSLIDINESVLSVREAIVALNAAMASAGITVDGSHANGLSYVPYDGYIAELHRGERVLTAEESRAYMQDNPQYGSGSTPSNAEVVAAIEALRKQQAEAEERQARRDAQIITANYDAHEQSARTIVEGNSDALDQQTYKGKAKVTLA